MIGPGKAGKWTKQKGMLAFYEICTKGTAWTQLFKPQSIIFALSVKQGWSKNDGNNNYGPFASSSRDKQWVGYDDVRSISKKAKYILENEYGGAAVWTLDLDDFNNLCCQVQNVHNQFSMLHTTQA